MASLTQATLSELSGAIVKQEKGVAVVAIFNYKGELVFREVGSRDKKSFKRKGYAIKTSLVRTMLILSMIESPDSVLGKSQYLLIKRNRYNSMVHLLPHTNLAMRLTFKKDIDGEILHNRLQPLLKKYVRE